MNHRVQVLVNVFIFLMVLLVSAVSLFCSQEQRSDTGSKLRNAEATTPDQSKDAEPAKKQPAAPEVTVYITSWCPACKMTLDFLKKEGIPHVVKDVEKNSEFFDEMVKKVGANRGVPVIDIKGKILLGFNPHVIKEMLR